MPDWSLVDRSHVLSAIEECDRLGSREFLSRYRFARAKTSTVWHGGQEYDSNALLGFAYLHATGIAVTRSEFAGHEAAAVRVLKGLGFDVVVDELELEREEQAQAAREAAAAEAAAASPATRSAPVRRAATPRKAAAARPTRAKPVERPVKVCPTCNTALPATGVCDFCD